MWVFKKDAKSWTCPDSGLVTIARIQATDKDDAFKECIVNNNIAKVYLEKQGFEVEHIEDEPLKEIPSYSKADWNNPQHRELYDRINDKSFNGIPLTQKEHDFSVAMYHAEEYYAGLL